jgi:effector-binding domain-containing protein
MRDGGHTPGAGPWESYLDDPSEAQDPSELRTEIFRPLATD